MSDREAARIARARDWQELAAMNASTYAMSEEDRGQWYRDHPLSDYEEAAAFLDEEGA